MANNINLYNKLKINKNASTEDIKKAYRKLAKEHHPDKNNGVESPEFIEISLAYNILSDEIKRQKYDDTGEYDSNTMDIHQLALQTLAACFFQIVKNPNYPYNTENLFDVMISTIGKATGQEKIKKRNAHDSIDRLNEINDRIIGEDNLFNEMINSEIRLNRGHLERIDREIEILNESLEIVKKYKYKTDEKEFLSFIDMAEQRLGAEWDII